MCVCVCVCGGGGGGGGWVGSRPVLMLNLTCLDSPVLESALDFFAESGLEERDSPLIRRFFLVAVSLTSLDDIVCLKSSAFLEAENRKIAEQIKTFVGECYSWEDIPQIWEVSEHIYDCCTYFQSITKIGQYHLAVTSETF